jgi:LmbE family N-acetylglucosaminyl deacetylase
MHVAILSPHCDDVPLSLGATLLERRLGTRPNTHVLFSKSGFTLMDRGARASQEVTALRHSEEQLAAQLASYAATFWDLPDALLRPGFDTTADLFDVTRDPAADPVYDELSAVVDRVVASGPDLVLSPLGCGEHMDHRLVRDVAIKMCQKRLASERLGFYEDLPYAGRLTLDRIAMRVAAVSSALIPVSVGLASLKAKHTLLGCYASQLTKRDLATVTSHAERVGGERVWMPNHNLAAVLATPDSRGPDD